MQLNYGRQPSMQLDYEDSNPALTTGLSTQPQGALSAATQTQPKVNELLYDPTLINETVQQPKFGGSFDNLYSTTPAPLSTPQFNFNGDPLYGSDPVGFDPNNLGFVADQATPDQTVPNISTIGNPFASFGGLDLNKPFKLPYNPVLSPPTTPEEQKQYDDYWAANPINIDPNSFNNMFSGGFDLNSKTGFTLNPPEEQKRLNDLDKIINPLTQQIIGQGLTDKWSGQGHGSADANARDMAKILAGIGITDIKQFGEISKPVEVYMGTDDSGNPIYETRIEKSFGNKLTGQAVPNTYSERQKGNFWGGTFEGKGNTGYGVQFDEQGNPYFYTQGASSSDIGKLAPILAIAQFIPALAPFATAANAAIAASQGNVLGAIAGAAGLGGYSDVANAANFAGAVKSGNPLSIISAGAGLGGTDLSGVADAAGLGDLNNIGGYNISDATKAYQAVKAIQSGDPSAIISTIGGYMQDQNNQTPPSSPLDSLVPIPSDRSDTFSGLEEPVDRSIATRSIESSIDDVINPSDIPSIGGDPMDLLPQLPDLPQAPATGQTQDLSDKSFGSAFAQARASGAKEFLWNDNVYNTNLAPKKSSPTYDSVGGGRGGQGGPTAEELSRYNQSNQFGGYDDVLESRAGSFNWGVKPKEAPGPYDPMLGTFMKATPDQLARFTPYPDTGVMRQQNVLNPMIPSSSTGNDYITKFINTAESSGYMNPDWGLYKPGVQLLSGSTWDPSKGSGAWVPQRQYEGTRGSIFLNDQTPYTGSEAANLLSHELVHVNQNLDTLYNSLTRNGQKELDKNLYSVLPYLKEKYGYFGGYDDNPNAPLAERMADLQGFQFNNKIDLAKDPVFQKMGLANDPKFNALWNASTIERSTRLDPRDLPPGKITESDYPKGTAPLYYRPIDRLTDYVSKKVKDTISGKKAEGGLASLKKSHGQ